VCVNYTQIESQNIQPEPPNMFEKILIANRGDQPPTGGAAAQPNSTAAVSRKGYFTAEINYV